MTARPAWRRAPTSLIAAALGIALATPALAAADPASLAPYFTPAGGGPKHPDPDGFLQRWLLLEPITKPNRSNAGFTGTYVRAALTQPYFPGQLTATPHAGQTEPVDGGLTWRALDATPFDVKLFNFALDYGKPTYGVIFWAVTEVDSPRDMRVRLAVGSNSASMWWVNGQEAVGLFGDRRMVQDDGVSVPITLHRGKNLIRGAVINGPGLSDFCVRFLDMGGRPVTDLTLEAK
jgi:hypothetical protein